MASNVYPRQDRGLLQDEDSLRIGFSKSFTKVIAVKAYELTIEEACLYMPKSLKALIRFLGMLLTSVVIVLCAI